jgi:hypothetical protein
LDGWWKPSQPAKNENCFFCLNWAYLILYIYYICAVCLTYQIAMVLVLGPSGLTLVLGGICQIGQSGETQNRDENKGKHVWKWSDWNLWTIKKWKILILKNKKMCIGCLISGYEAKGINVMCFSQKSINLWMISVCAS